MTVWGMSNLHKMLSWKLAMSIWSKAKNYITWSHLCQKFLEFASLEKNSNENIETYKKYYSQF